MSNYNGQFQDSSANVLLGTPHSYANIEGATSSQAYLKGQMIVFNNRLCEVTATIAQGDTLAIGTNIAYKNVGDIGKQLVASDGTGFYFDVKDGEYGYYPSASKTASEFVPFGGADTIDYFAWVTGTTGGAAMIVLHDPTQDKFQLSSTNVISNECFSGYASVRNGQVKASKAGQYLVVYNSYLWDMTNYSCRIIDAQVNDVLISWTTGNSMNGGFAIPLF